MNRADLFHAVLSDGQPHDRHDIFQRAGCFFLTNNAASELRARGETVEHWREGTIDFYRLVSLDEAEPQSSEGVAGGSASSREHGQAQALPAPEHDGGRVPSPLQLDLFGAAS